jgi:hypothetical protein
MKLQAYLDRRYFLPTGLYDNLKFPPCIPSKSFFQHQRPSCKVLLNKLEAKQFVFVPECSWMTLSVGELFPLLRLIALLIKPLAHLTPTLSVHTRGKPTRQENIAASCNLCYLNDLLTLLIRFAWHDNVHNELFSLELVGVCVSDQWHFHRR